MRRHQFQPCPDVGRLDEIVVDTGVGRVTNVFFLPVAAQRDDQRIRAGPAPKMLGQFVPAHVRKPDIEHDDIGGGISPAMRRADPPSTAHLTLNPFRVSSASRLSAEAARSSTTSTRLAVFRFRCATGAWAVVQRHRPLLKAIQSGQGVGLLPAAMVATELADGSLIQLLDTKHIEAFAYYLVYPEDRQNEPKIVAFRE